VNRPAGEIKHGLRS